MGQADLFGAIRSVPQRTVFFFQRPNLLADSDVT